MKKYYVKIIKIGLLLICIFQLVACGNSEITNVGKENNVTNVLSVEQFKNEEKVVTYFNDKNVQITSLKLEKRQTNQENKEDKTWVYITAENDIAKIEGVFIIISSFYDIGGWQVDSIYSEEKVEYEPKGYPSVQVTSPDYEVESVNYDSVDKYKYKSHYNILVNKGSILETSVPYSVICNFNTNKGIWYATENVGEVEYRVEDSFRYWSVDGISMLLKIENNILYPISYISDYTGNFTDDDVYWKITSEASEIRERDSHYSYDVTVVYTVNGESNESSISVNVPMYRFSYEALESSIEGYAYVYVEADNLLTSLNSELVCLNKGEEIDVSECVTVPNLRKLMSDEAEAVLNDLDLRMFVGMDDHEWTGRSDLIEGEITSQSIAAGECVPRGTEIIVGVHTDR